MTWPTKKLGEVANFQKGKMMPNYTVKEEGTTPYILIDNLRSNNYSHFTPSNQGTACLQTDTLLAWDGANAGTIGGGLVGFVGSTITKVSPVEKVDPVFLRMFLSSKSSEFNKQVHGAAIPHLNKDFVYNLPVPVPPINIQKKIVERLDAIRKAQELCDQQIQKTEELFESLLNTFYSQKEGGFRKIKDGATLRGGYAFKSKDFILEGIQVIRMGNVKRNSIDLSASPAFLPEEFVNKYSNYTLQRGDIIISMTGTVGKEDYGNVAIIEESHELLLNQRVGKFVINTDIFKPLYLYYFCQTKDFRKQVFSLGKGVRQANISGSQIESIKIPVLTIKEQQEIVEKLEAVQNYKKLLLKQKSLLEELFASVLDKCMKGDWTNGRF